MKTKLKVAVLMPVFNGGKKLAKAIDSVLTQTYPREYITLFLVDNMSTDFSVANAIQTLEDYNQSEKYQAISKVNYRHLFCTQPGIVPALNKGLFAIMGESGFDLVARLDADDTWMPDKLEKQVQFMIDNPKVDILGTNILRVDQNGNTLGEFTYPSEDKQIKEMLFGGQNAIAHPSVVFRPDVILRTGGYDNTYPIAEDYHLWLKAAKWFTLANLNEVLIKYTVSHNPKYNPLCPQMACMAMKQAYQRLHEKL